MASSLQKSRHAFRFLLPSGNPSPRCPLPGYLRAFAAEAVPDQRMLETTGGEHSSLPPAPPDSETAMQDAARQAYAQLVNTIFSQAVHAAESAPHTPAFEGLQALEEQRRAAGIENEAGAVLPHISRTLAAVRYHQRLIDGTQ